MFESHPSFFVQASQVRRTLGHFALLLSSLYRHRRLRVSCLRVFGDSL